MDRRMKEVFDSARRVLDPIGFKFRMVGGKSHPHLVISKDESDVGIVKFSLSPRTAQKDYVRQGITKLLRSKGFVNNQRRAVAGGSTSPGS